MRPTSSGTIYNCYKDSKKAYRHSCQAALHCKMIQTAKLISKLYGQNKSAKLWNIIRKPTKAKQSQGGIGLPWWSTSQLSL